MEWRRRAPERGGLGSGGQGAGWVIHVDVGNPGGGKEWG